MSEPKFDNWVADGSEIKVEGSGEDVAATWDATIDTDVSLAMADLIAREHNMIPGLLSRIREKDLVIEELQAQLRMVQRAQTRQCENLQADILMLRALHDAVKPLVRGLAIGDLTVWRGYEGRQGLLTFREYADAIVNAMQRVDMVELYYTPIEGILQGGFHGYISQGRGDTYIEQRARERERWQQAAKRGNWENRGQREGAAQHGSTGQQAAGPVGNPEKGAQPPEKDGPQAVPHGAMVRRRHVLRGSLRGIRLRHQLRRGR